MSKYGSKLLMGMLLATGLMTKSAEAQTSVQNALSIHQENAKGITPQHASYGNQASYNKGAHNLSKVVDDNFIHLNEESGFKIESRALGFIQRGEAKPDSVMFYKISKQNEDGSKVEGRIALAHASDKLEGEDFSSFEAQDQTYSDWTITSPEGKKTSIIFNRKNIGAVGDTVDKKFLTTIIKDNGKQYLITMAESTMLGRFHESISQDLGDLNKFIDHVTTKDNKSVFNNPRPGYAGQDKVDGTFDIISIDGTGFSRLVEPQVLYQTRKAPSETPRT